MGFPDGTVSLQSDNLLEDRKYQFFIGLGFYKRSLFGVVARLQGESGILMQFVINRKQPE